MIEKKFHLGSRVTFLSKKNCTSRDGNYNNYLYGGDDQEGISAFIIEYIIEHSGQNCWKIKVQFEDKSNVLRKYNMLEREFVEFHKDIHNNDFLPSKHSDSTESDSIIPPLKRKRIKLNFNN